MASLVTFVLINFLLHQLAFCRLEDIPMGAPELNDQFSQGLAAYIGHELPGSDRGLFGATSGGAMGRSASSANSGNDINNMYNNFQIPSASANLNGMRKWYGPEFAPPMPPVNGMRGPGPVGYNTPPQSFQGPQPNTSPLNDGGIQVSDLSCSNLRSIIGLSNDRNHWLSTVECECRLTADQQRQFYCYSLCDPPKAAHRCKPNFSILNSCPSYTNCANWTQLNDTEGGAITCKLNEPIPESICWILASSSLREDGAPPLRPAFYANSATGCYMSCLCGNDGTIAGQVQCLKAPTSHWTFPIYPRSKKFEFGQDL